jgi:hypothetical protein
MSSSDAKLVVLDKDEETKSNANEKHPISRQEAISLIMRLRLFA